MQPIEREPAKPTIYVRWRCLPPLLPLFGGLLLFGGTLYAYWNDSCPPWIAGVGLVAGPLIVGLAAWVLCDRRPKLIISAEGIDIALYRTGLIRWQEIIHVEQFRLRQQGGVALFLTSEAQARMPREAMSAGTPVFANEAFASPPVWFGDGMLEYTACEIAAEIMARQRNQAGPLTDRLRSG